MCRFLCYKGPPVLLSDWLYRPKNSLVLQSYNAKERKEPLNGDGFGVGWYTPEVCTTPCVCTSVTPAWSNSNLQRLAEHIKSPCFFAHVRAASPGMRVAEVNCHPFQYGRYLWMHNGTVEGFTQIKRRLLESLSDPLYHVIQGTTDSEHAFAVFLNLLGDADSLVSARHLGRTLVKTVAQLEQWTAEAGVSSPSYYNFAVTDGYSIAALRYVSDQMLEPVSLYYSLSDEAFIIASEPLTDQKRLRVAPNHLLTVITNLEVILGLIEMGH